MQRTDSFVKTLLLGKIEGKRRGDNRGWDGWMASLTQWTWVWVNSGGWWWTGRLGCWLLQSMGSRRVTLSNWTELNWCNIYIVLAPLVAQMVKNLPAMTWIRSLDGEDPLEKGMAIHSSILAWKIPWTEDSGRLQSMGSQSQTWLSTCTLTHIEYNIYSCLNQSNLWSHIVALTYDFYWQKGSFIFFFIQSVLYNWLLKICFFILL